jgi:membrane protein DedA with SNARE-associated domain
MASLEEFVDAHGLPAIAFVIVIEPMGIPLPAETAALFGGFLAHTGHLSLSEVMAVCIVAAIIGDNAGYWLGHHGGRRLLARFGHWLLLPAHRVAAAARFYDRHGGKAVLAERWLPGLRVLGPWTAGITRFPWRRFLAFDIATSIAWGIVTPLAGYLLGASFERFAGLVGTVGTIALVGLVLGVMAVAGLRHIRRDLQGPRFDEAELEAELAQARRATDAPRDDAAGDGS